eukprot:38697-Amorphochlora_amoeboformis.AAC.1
MPARYVEQLSLLHQPRPTLKITQTFRDLCEKREDVTLRDMCDSAKVELSDRCDCHCVTCGYVPVTFAPLRIGWSSKSGLIPSARKISS